MNSNAIFTKIQKRNKYVMKCGNTRNNSYSDYLKACLSYDNLKNVFYIAIKLSKHDCEVPEEQLERYEHFVKHVDRQLLNELKERDYAIQKIQIETDIEKDTFHARITKIELEGLSRNRMFYEYIDNNKEFNDAKILFHNEIALAVRDGLITDIDHQIYNQSIKMIDKNFEGEMIQIRKDYNQKRIHGYGHNDQYYAEQYCRGRGRNSRGQGRNGRGQGRISRGQGRISRGQGRISRQGRNGRGRRPH